MQGNPQIVAELNKLLKNELTAINQYFLHARMMGHWGFERMAKKIYEESIGEMKHADKLMKRILVLDGLAQPSGSRPARRRRDRRRMPEGRSAAGERGARPRWSRRSRFARSTEATMSAARSSSTSWRMPRSTSISSRPSCRWSTRSASRTTCRRRSAKARKRAERDPRAKRLGVTREARQVSSEKIRRRGLLVGSGLRDALAHVARRSCRIEGSCRRRGIRRRGGGRPRGRRRRLRVHEWLGRCR